LDRSAKTEQIETFGLARAKDYPVWRRYRDYDAVRL
jgi:hypothetical protein